MYATIKLQCNRRPIESRAEMPSLIDSDEKNAARSHLLTLERILVRLRTGRRLLIKTTAKRSLDTNTVQVQAYVAYYLFIKTQ